VSLLVFSRLCSLRSVQVSVILALVLFAATALRAQDRASAALNVRALWVTRATLTSPDSITRMVDAARASGFNTLIVQVRGRGDAYYESDLEPRAQEIAGQPKFDPLQLTLEQAHEKGLAVHAWVAVNLVSSAATLPAARTHLVYRHPEWLMVPRELASEFRRLDPRSPEYLGRLARWSRGRSDNVEGLYASPIHPEAAAHIAEVVGDLVKRYAVDGIHLDYVRYPGEDFDYSRAAIEQFTRSVVPDMTAAERQTAAERERVDPLAYPNLYPERWDAFRRSRLTALVMRVRTAVKSARPDAVISAAVVPDVQAAFDTRMQDWRTWIDQSLIDVLCPMAYSTDPAVFAQQVADARQYAGYVTVWAGIGAYRLKPAETLQFIDTARRLGTSGIVLFSYDSLIAPPNTAGTLSDLGRAAFGTSSSQEP
jgi:uncharacterized lipoprotein YddW (UPF0748 family)